MQRMLQNGTVGAVLGDAEGRATTSVGMIRRSQTR
jgi:hypothetical protein